MCVLVALLTSKDVWLLSKLTSYWAFIQKDEEHVNLANNLCFFLSPSGKLVQIEYALAAVAGGAPSVGIKGN
jgi:hypothetical protein